MWFSNRTATLFNNYYHLYTLCEHYNMPLYLLWYSVVQWCVQIGGSPQPSSPLTFTLGYNYPGHVTPGWVLLTCFLSFLSFQAHGSILVRNPFSYEHLSQCVYYSLFRTHHPWLARLSTENEGDVLEAGDGSVAMYGLPVRDRPVLTTASSGMDYCCAVTSLCGWKAFSLINVQHVCASGCARVCKSVCAREYM